MSGLVQCQVCGNKFELINSAHLQKHGLTVSSYLERFPNAQLSSPIFNEKIKSLWNNNDYRNKQNKTLQSRVSKLHNDKIGLSLEEIVKQPELARLRMSISHIGKTQSPETIEKRCSKTRGEKHAFWGTQRPETQRKKHSDSMLRKFVYGELDGYKMIRKAKGDNLGENTFARLHPTYLRQFSIHLPIEIIKRERNGKRGGFTTPFVDFYDPETNTVYEIERDKAWKDITKRTKNERRERILRELGYNMVWISKEQFLNDS